MLNQTSEKFRKLFILEFTKELINAHSPESIFKLQKLIEKKEKESEAVIENKTIKDFVRERERKIIPQESESKNFRASSDNLKRSLETLKRINPVIRIPETKLPPTFSYLKPSPTNLEIDLGKLNPFVNDPLVNAIECNGSEDHILVRGAMGTKPTKIVLNKEEINSIIRKFAEESKIPFTEGVFKAVVGKLSISAIISQTVDSKFIIKKLKYQPDLIPRRN